MQPVKLFKLNYGKITSIKRVFCNGTRKYFFVLQDGTEKPAEEENIYGQMRKINGIPEEMNNGYIQTIYE